MNHQYLYFTQLFPLVLAQTLLPILDTIYVCCNAETLAENCTFLFFFNNFHSYYMRGLMLDAEKYMQSSLFCGFVANWQHCG